MTQEIGVIFPKSHSSWNLGMIFLTFLYLFLAVLGLSCCTGFSLVVMLGLLIAVASLAAEHGLIAVVHRLRSSEACGIFPDQGSNPCLLHWQVDSLPLSHLGTTSPLISFFGRGDVQLTAPAQEQLQLCAGKINRGWQQGFLAENTLNHCSLLRPPAQENKYSRCL